MLEDESLYERYLGGDDSALDELLVRYRDALTLFLYSIVKNEADAEDLMMDTFALLLVKKPGFGKRSSFRTWLFGIGHNLARNHNRKKKFLLFGGGEEQTELPDAEGPENGFLHDERNIQLYRAMQNLREDYRTVLHLQFFQEMNADETALIMKKSKKQIYNLTNNAKNRLKEILLESGFTYEND